MLTRSKADATEILQRVFDEVLLYYLDAQSCWMLRGTCKTMRRTVQANMFKFYDKILRSVGIISDDALCVFPLALSITRLNVSRTSVSSVGLNMITTSIPRLVELNLEWCRCIDDRGFLSLNSLVTLKHLNVSNTRIHHNGIVGLSCLTTLTTLRMHDSYLTDGSSIGLITLRNLTSLDVCRTRLGDRGARRIPVESLTALYVKDCVITNEAVMAISRKTDLRYLDISENYFMNDEEGLLSLDNCRRLIELDLSALQNASAHFGLRSLKNMVELRYLNLSDTALDVQNTEGLWHISHLPSLTTLILIGSNIDDECMHAVAQIKNLTHLNVSDNVISDVSIKTITTLTSLRCMLANATTVSDRAAKFFAQFTELTFLDLKCTMFGTSGANDLYRRRGRSGYTRVAYTDRMGRSRILNIVSREHKQCKRKICNAFGREAFMFDLESRESMGLHCARDPSYGVVSRCFIHDSHRYRDGDFCICKTRHEGRDAVAI